MKLFIAAAYSAHVDYETGEVAAEYKAWLEDVLTNLEALGHQVFCALRADQYKINNADPAAAFKLDIANIEQSDALIALLGDTLSAGVQLEIGVAVALKKQILFAHSPEYKLAYYNAAMLQAGVAREIALPITSAELKAALENKPSA